MRVLNLKAVGWDKGVNDSSWGRAHQYLTPPPQSHLWEVGFRELQEGTCTAPSVENVGANAKSSRAGCVTIYQMKNIKRLACKFSCGQEAFPNFLLSLFIFKLRGNYAVVQNPLLQFPGIWFWYWTQGRNYPQKIPHSCGQSYPIWYKTTPLPTTVSSCISFLTDVPSYLSWLFPY